MSEPKPNHLIQEQGSHAPVPQPESLGRQLDDELLLRRAFEQDSRTGLELLFRRYYAPLCSHAVRFVYSRQIAEDLVNEVFLQV